MADSVSRIPGLSMVKPDGAFYAFVNISHYRGKGPIVDSADFASYLLEKHYVSCVPGGAFGSEDHVRFSFATGEETIIKGLERGAGGLQRVGMTESGPVILVTNDDGIHAEGLRVSKRLHHRWDGSRSWLRRPNKHGRPCDNALRPDKGSRSDQGREVIRVGHSRYPR